MYVNHVCMSVNVTFMQLISELVQSSYAMFILYSFLTADLGDKRCKEADCGTSTPC